HTGGTDLTHLALCFHTCTPWKGDASKLPMLAQEVLMDPQSWQPHGSLSASLVSGLRTSPKRTGLTRTKMRYRHATFSFPFLSFLFLFL
ncbi:mCG145124, partial [Mus musculus]